MITCIEIDGFKSFKNFKLELSPFQMIIGPNGVGKSNLFAALGLLSRLANMDIQYAFLAENITPDDLFTVLPEGFGRSAMQLAIEMFVDSKNMKPCSSVRDYAMKWSCLEMNQTV